MNPNRLSRRDYASIIEELGNHALPENPYSLSPQEIFEIVQDGLRAVDNLADNGVITEDEREALYLIAFEKWVRHPQGLSSLIGTWFTPYQKVVTTAVEVLSKRTSGEGHKHAHGISAF